MMKYIILILTIFMGLLSCMAQSPIVAIEEREPPYNEGVYYKDINGVFDPFIGTWVWQDGNNSITIEIIKIEMEHQEGHLINEYRDDLYGRIKYIKNGVEVFNTFNDLTYCLENKNGAPTNGKLNFRFKDPLLTNKKGHIDFDLINNGTQAIFRLRNTSGVRFKPEDLNEDPEFSMPRRVEFTLTKL